jgi:cytochrome c oxidase subunit IV
MSEHVDAHFHKHIKACIGVFLLLMVFTLVTVGVSFVNLGHVGNIVVALVIATFKALLVAAYFMHLNSEKSMIYKVLVFTFIFFFGLMLITLFALHGEIGVTH